MDGFKKWLNKVFIEGLSGMATGLFATLIIGIIVGIVMGPDASVFKPLGDLFIQLIKMLVVPLVLVSIISGATNLLMT